MHLPQIKIKRKRNVIFILIIIILIISIGVILNRLEQPNAVKAVIGTPIKINQDFRLT